MAVLQPPRTYYEWAVILDIFEARTDDEAALAAMAQGELSWQDAVAERFSKRLLGAVNSRLAEAKRRFERSTSQSRGQERVLIQAISDYRQELRLLCRAVDLPAIPTQYRSKFQSLIRAKADQVQSSLEDSAKTDRSGKLASIVRNNKINSI